MKYKLRLTFYSPVHIGSGQEVEPFEYVVKDGYLCLFSFEQFIALLSKEEREKLVALQRDQKPSVLKDIRNFVRHRINMDIIQERIPISAEVAELYKDKFFKETNALSMDSFIKTLGAAYIPGSSLKGVLRTAVLNRWVKDGDKDEFDILRAKTPDRNGKPKDDISLDVFKYLKVPDIMLKGEQTIFRRVVNFHMKQNKLQETDIQLLKEVTCSLVFREKEGEAGKGGIEFLLQVDEERMRDIRMEVGRKDLTFEKIWQSLDFYERLLKSEQEKWSLLNNNLKSFYEGFRNYIVEERKSKDIKIIRIGYGSGFEAVTVAGLVKTFKEQKHGNSLNLCEGKYPLGWVVLERWN